MSQENVEEQNVRFVRDGYARFNAGERVPELWFFTPDAEYHAAREDPDSAIHRGLDAVRRQYARWVESYPDLTGVVAGEHRDVRRACEVLSLIGRSGPEFH